MKILISAAEASSDAHGAELLKALKSEGESRGIEVEAFGIGGPRLRSAGLRVLVDARQLLAMGFLEILGQVTKIFSALKKISDAVTREKPDLAVVIDYPDFHFRLVRRLKEQSVPAVYFIPPKVWAWRKKRVVLLKKFFTKVLCIFPFEQRFYQAEGIPAVYVGNPLVDELPLTLTRDLARTRLGLNPKEPVLLLMPGTRASELKHHLGLLLNSATRISKRLRERGALGPGARLKVLMPFSESVDIRAIDTRISAWAAVHADSALLEIRSSQGNSGECMVAADAGLIKSGTSTLEAGLLGCPHVIVYKTNWVTAVLFKYLIRYRGAVGLVNLVASGGPVEAGPRLVQEILLSDATVQRLTDEGFRLMTDPLEQNRLRSGFLHLRGLLGSPSSGAAEGPSRRAAREILDLAAQVARGQSL